MLSVLFAGVPPGKDHVREETRLGELSVNVVHSLGQRVGVPTEKEATGASGICHLAMRSAGDTTRRSEAAAHKKTVVVHFHSAHVIVATRTHRDPATTG